ncbi:hypothetical protein L1765_02980 [Microaerobacter geothermalis]|uniref:hypothetical protein n=1 Tax=Microaerobacter geothermalis TaxID=674972 RepID=UPI001F25738B|nr:hypothetical protein [Microaerobacter geothermalis]MCF6092960.1 hypothetical protein [Microaerobacter geothermalis]
MIKKYGILLFALLFILSGCSPEITPEEREKITVQFVNKANDILEQHENGKKMLQQVMDQVSKGMKRTKAQNAIDQGRKVTERIKQDLFGTPVPEDMVQLKEKILLALDKRIKGYQQLFNYYDFQDEKYLKKGEELLNEADQLFHEVKDKVNP